MITHCVDDMMKWMFVILLVTLGGFAFGQVSQPISSTYTGMASQKENYIPRFFETPLRFSYSNQLPSSNTFSIRRIPSLDHLPSLFCKLEYKLETKSKLAPRFRLGSLQYTEWMEGKTDLYLRYD